MTNFGPGERVRCVDAAVESPDGTSVTLSGSLLEGEEYYVQAVDRGVVKVNGLWLREARFEKVLGS